MVSMYAEEPRHVGRVFSRLHVTFRKGGGRGMMQVHWVLRYRNICTGGGCATGAGVVEVD